MTPAFIAKELWWWATTRNPSLRYTHALLLTDGERDYQRVRYSHGEPTVARTTITLVLRDAFMPGWLHTAADVEHFLNEQAKPALARELNALGFVADPGVRSGRELLSC
jgi:hypothetical protein